MSVPLLRIHDLKVRYRVRCGAWRHAHLQALAGIELSVRAHEALGVVGESGSGKSTLARAILNLVPRSAGRILWSGEDIDALARAPRQRLRRDLAIIFQNPLASLDPRMQVEELIGEPLRVHRTDLDARDRRRAVLAWLLQLGLGAELARRYPHELSGGQCQRVAIARAMILQPKLLICDEAVSALDVSVQAQIIGLLGALKDEYGLALLFISHNLAVVRELCERVLVLYLGRMMELAPTALLHEHPLHPYTRALFASLPIPIRISSPAGWRRPWRASRPRRSPRPPGAYFARAARTRLRGAAT